MLPLTAARREPAPSRRDPAPSRLKYRLNRLWLRPRVRTTVNLGVPLAVGLLAAWTAMATLDLRGRITAAWEALHAELAGALGEPECARVMAALDLATELGVPVHLVKVVSDNADETAHDWSAAVDGCARELGAWLADFVRLDRVR